MHSNPKFTLFIAVLFLSLFSQGCTQDRAVVDKKIIAHDPSFAKVLEERNVLEKKLFAQKTIFLKEKAQIDNTINSLRQEKLELKGEYSEQVERVRQQLDSTRLILRESLARFRQVYRVKKQEISDINDDIKEVNGLVSKKDKLSLTQEEMQTWNTRFSSLIERREKAFTEKNNIEKEIEITKLKMEALKMRWR